MDINSDSVIAMADAVAKKWGLKGSKTGAISAPSGHSRRPRRERRNAMAGVVVVKLKRRKVATVH